MADDSRDNLHLLFMQDLLPVGIGILQRAKKGGPTKLAELFTSSSDPLNDLRSEGEAAAFDLRERLDQVSPGLGNPVMSVTVSVEENSKSFEDEMQDTDFLIDKLNQIYNRLEVLEEALADSSERNL